MSSASSQGYDHSFKVVMVGDPGVGKSSLLLTYVSGAVTNIPRTLGVDMKMKELTVGNKRLKLTIWDTAGQERYRTLTSTYYRDAHGIILVYDVTQKQTFTNLANLWTKEIELYSTNKDCIKLLVGNKVDKESERAVSILEGKALAKEHGFLFLESSAITRENVEKCFEDLAHAGRVREKKKQQEELEKKKQQESKQKQSENKPQEQKPVEIKPEPYTGVPGGGRRDGCTGCN